MSTGELRIALVHDELTRRGGAEVVFESLIELFPQAHVYALYAGRPRIRVRNRFYPVQTSFLQSWPLWWRSHPSRLLPLLAHAAEQFDFSGYDVVLSSSSGFAKAIVTRSNVPHICYCHAPTRYLWESSHEVLHSKGLARRGAAGLLFHYLRLVDFTAAQRVDTFLANSRYTQSAIHTYYRRYSEVVYPPIRTEFFFPAYAKATAGVAALHPMKVPYFLCVGRLTPTKNFDQAIRVCEKLRLPLVVVGTGRDLARLQKYAGRYTSFTGKVSDERLREYYRGARAFLQPGREDFGMAAVEALACGVPVIAYGQGGVREVISQPETGYLYNEEREEFLAEAVRVFLDSSRVFPAEVLQRVALRFSRQRFRNAIYSYVSRAVDSRQVPWNTRSTLTTSSLPILTPKRSIKN